MKINNAIVADAAQYVSLLLQEQLCKAFYYHDFFHTLSVVNAVDMLCAANGIADSEKRILLIAAWFHDTGYARQMEDHEEAGALIAESFLKSKGVEEAEIELIKQCIMATLYPQQPVTKLERILCDADMFHLSEPNFMERSNLLRKEWAETKNKNFSDKEWLKLNVEFMRQHGYHTEYCIERLAKAKNKNINRLLAELKEIEGAANIKSEEKTAASGEAKKSKREKQPQLERGVETLFKLTSGNHMRLSAMADNKAHILLSINSIIISVTLSLLAKYLDEMPKLILPTIMLLCVCLVTIVFAVLTTKPKVSKGVFTMDQIHNKQANLLFFGNFHNMEWESYDKGIQTIMHDKEYLYKSMTKDIYFLGKVLAAKYHYLNIGYKVFMYGLITAVCAFAVSFIWS